MHHDICPAVPAGTDGHGSPRAGKTRSRDRNFEDSRRKVCERKGAVLRRGDTLRFTVCQILESNARIRNTHATAACNSAGKRLSSDLGIQCSRYLQTKHQNEKPSETKKLFFPICIAG